MSLIHIKQRIYRCAIVLFAVALSTTLTNNAVYANDNGSSTKNSVETLKRDLLELNKELFILEEELLFPANTQVAIFISQDAGLLFKMDHAKVLLNNKAVNYHLYTDNELNALSRGAVRSRAGVLARLRLDPRLAPHGISRYHGQRVSPAPRPSRGSRC